MTLNQPHFVLHLGRQMIPKFNIDSLRAGTSKDELNLIQFIDKLKTKSRHYYEFEPNEDPITGLRGSILWSITRNKNGERRKVIKQFNEPFMARVFARKRNIDYMKVLGVYPQSVQLGLGLVADFTMRQSFTIDHLPVITGFKLELDQNNNLHINQR